MTVKPVILKYKDYEVAIQRKTNIKKVYIEITNRCNLSCKMCFRNFQKDPMGEMSFENFKLILNQVKDLEDVEVIYLGGIGEPTYHPDFSRMLSILKDTPYKIQISSNGTLIKKYEEELIKNKVDLITISIDSPNPLIYKDIRGTEFHNVFDNIQSLNKKKEELGSALPNVAVEVLVMKGNIKDLINLIRLAGNLNVSSIIFSNPVPLSLKLSDEIVYGQCESEEYKELVNKMQSEAGKYRINIKIPEFSLKTERVCQFIASNSVVIKWDGSVAPCYRFLHSYPECIFKRKKMVQSYSFGNVFKEHLRDIYLKREFVEFRFSVLSSNYPSCIDCNLRDACDYAKESLVDCWGNSPSCGDCLWSRGIIQCP